MFVNRDMVGIILHEQRE